LDYEEDRELMATQAAQPLFYKHIVPLNKEQHGDLHVEPREDFSFAKGTNSVYIAAIEFLRASKEYPIVFGGAGDMGSEAVRDIAGSSYIGRVVIADYNGKAAQKLADEIAEDYVEAVFFDADDHDGTVALMREADVCLSCVGPFYQYEEKMIRAAVEAKSQSRKNRAVVCTPGAGSVWELGHESGKKGSWGGRSPHGGGAVRRCGMRLGGAWPGRIACSRGVGRPALPVGLAPHG